MKVVILAGGLGTRIAEESHLRPKPMIEIGGRPILWHIMKIYAHHGLTDFVICCGYKAYVIKEYFANYVLHSSDVTIDTGRGEITYHQTAREPWTITLVDTGLETMTGGRLKRVADYLGERFCLTYGDGVADIDVSATIAFHERHGRLATVTSVVPPGRYGALELGTDGRVARFAEKPPGDGGPISGGFFVLDRAVIDRIEDDTTALESTPLISLAEDGELMAWRHDGFWQSMDTLRDRTQLEAIWASGKAPWKVWT
ncbi:MAG: glucose-1-phosphate cytidylyltransferase [Pseudomonadota bacterium]